MRIEELRAFDVRVPFEHSVSGFNSDWWCGGSPIRGRKYFSVFRDGIEVARAEVDPSSSDVGEHPGTTTLESIVKIEFFEVREDFRCLDIGRQAVALIAAQFEGLWITALSAVAGGFWRAIGWTETLVEGQPSRSIFMFVRAPGSHVDGQSKLGSGTGDV